MVIIWDISNSYNIKHVINTNYDGNIWSCLLVFPFNIKDNYIITSIDDIYNYNYQTKIYSLNDGKFIKNNKDSVNIIF